MKLSVNIIYENLPFAKRHLWDTDVNNRVIEDILFLHDNIDFFRTDHLYVGSINLLPPFEKIPDNANFLCYGKSPFSPEKELPFNLIMIEEDVPVYELFNLLQGIVTKYYIWQEKLEAAIQQEATFQDFIDFSSNIIKWPLSIIDIAQGTLAISNITESDDFIWKELQNGYIRTELCIQDSIQNEQFTSGSFPLQMYLTISDRTLLAQAIRVHNHTVGFVLAHRPATGTERFPRSVEQLLNYLTVAISKRMSRNEFYCYSRGFVLDCLIKDLIDKKITNLDIIKDRFEFAKWAPYKESYISIIQTRQKTAGRSRLQSMLEQVEKLLPYAKALYYHGKIIILQQVSDDDIYNKKSDRRFLQWLQSNDAYCGISNRFTNYAKLADYYIQAEKAIYFGNTLNPAEFFHLYRDYIQEHMYETLSQCSDLRLFIHPDIYQLLNLNRTRDYIFETVKYFVKNDFNIINTSKDMFVHKNTLSYRLRQIEELSDFSFNDPNIRTILSESISMLSYMITFLHYNIDTDSYEDH